MLVIRKKNLHVLSEALHKGMSARLVKYMMARFPHVFGEDAEAARGLLERVCAVAEEYGIKNDRDVAMFADLSVMYGEDFHRQPWAVDVLTSDTLTPRDKMLELQDRVYESGALM
jgi:CHAD domain-containing protein